MTLRLDLGLAAECVNVVAGDGAGHLKALLNCGLAKGFDGRVERCPPPCRPSTSALSRLTLTFDTSEEVTV